MKNKRINRLLATILAMVMVLGMLPAGALAARVDDEPMAAIPAGEEAVQAAAPKTDAPLGSADAVELLADETAAYEIPGYTLVDAAANALPTGEDNPYLMVAWYGSEPYALYLKEGAASLSDTPGNAFAAGKNKDLTATLTIGTDQVSAAYAKDSSAVAMEDLHVFFAPAATAGQYTIRSATGYDLNLSNTNLATAANASSVGQTFAATKLTSATTDAAGAALNGGYLLKSTANAKCLSVLYPSANTLNSFCLNWCGVGGSGSVNETTGVKTLANNCVFYSRIHLYTKNPEPGETIEHHQPTEGMVQYYLKKESGWVGSTTASDVKLATNNGAVQCSAEDIVSGIYGIWSLTHWMHVSDNAVNYCTVWGDHNDQHSFRFAYDATAKGYTIQSQSTGKYLRAERGTLSMGDTGTIFYIDKVAGRDFYNIWWESEIRPGEAISGMFDTAADNTWVFTGGEDVASGWAQTGGKRSFMGHFEEYVRWTYAQSGNRDSTTLERYTVNTAYAGLTLTNIVGDWNKYVADYNPRAVVYMVGAEDKDDANFSEHLTAFINNAIALREGDGFAVIMKSYDSSLSALNTAVDTVLEGLKSDSDKYNRVVVANTALTDAQLTGDGHPNAAGHLELSKQLVTAACPNSNTGGNFPTRSGGAGIKNLQEVAAPATYDTAKVPTVDVTGGTMTITLNGVDAFRYELRLDNGVTIYGTGANDSATVTDVPENVGYTLVTRSADGATQYKTLTTPEATLSTLQQELVAKVDDKTTPLTWLFMGDSITHACHHLSGYDSVAQLTEDFLDTIGRDKDVVINTAVSSATTTSTLENIQYRLNQFPAPDVASIMLGTNDGVISTTYTDNLNAIIAAIRAKNPNAIIILRSPTGFWTNGHASVEPHCEVMKEVAAEKDCIYVDQYTETQGMLDTYSSWIRNNNANFPFQVYYGNDLHPGAKAQLDMAKMFFKGTGLWDEDNPISNLDYVLTTAEDSVISVGGALEHTAGTLTLNVDALGGSLGETTLTATNAAGQSWSVTAKAGTNPALTLPDGTYTVTASGIKTNAAKTVTFASAEVEVGENAPPIEIETGGYPEPNAGKVQNYLDFGATWVSVTAPAALELHGVSGSTFTKDTDGIDSGVYGILDSTPGDGGAARWMHVSGNVTNQCSGEPNTHVAAHSFTFTYNAEKKAYTIQSVSTGKYLTQTRSGSQFAVNDTPTWFYVSPANPENNDGTYYIWWETEPQLGGAIGEMFNAEPGNTWVFTGGADVAGQFDQTRGRRSFAGQAEEYFRWHFNLRVGAGENDVGGFSPSRQRYVINTAYAGLTLNAIVSEDGWQERVTDFAPRAVTYMVGKEDLEHEASFETDLAAFIDKATALRDGRGFAVIMKSYDSDLSALNAKVDSVVAGYRTTAAGKYSRIVVVDAPTLTAAQMTADGHPNADGHMELGRQLAVAVCGSAGNFPGNAQNRYTETAMPAFDKTVTPTVAFGDGVMTISGLSGAFKYEVKLANGVSVSGMGSNGTATVTDLPDGTAYSLITRTTDDATQYATVYGTVNGGLGKPALNSEQQKIADLLAAHPNDSLTWLFVGDSITHGILVSGYDSAPQLMEEYLDTIGREKDVVVNAGVSSATTDSTLNAQAYRLDPFTADVAIIMLGTNDCSTNLTGDQKISKEKYKENLGRIVAAIRAKNENAIIVLRTPTGFWDDKHPQMSEYVAQMKAFADEQGLILVDQMTATQGAINNYPWCKSGAQFYGDNLHPGVVGQLKIFQMLIREMGLWNDDNEICNLDYLWTGMTTENSATDVSGAVHTNGSTLSLNVSTLDANLGRTILTATNAAGQSWSVLAEAGETPMLTLPDGTYTVTATGVMKNTAKTVTFAAAEVTLPVSTDPVEPTLPEGMQWAYVSFTSGTPSGNVGWGTSAEPYSITLYKESAVNTDGEKVTEMANGVYKLWSGNRWMHVDNTDNKDKTNQCTGNDNAHGFRFTSTGDGYYTIKSVASTGQDRYLNIGDVGSYNQLPCTATPTKFVVEKVDGEGMFVIKTAVYPPFNFKVPVTSGINQTMTYQQVTQRDAVKGDGTMYAVVAPNVNGGTRAMWATDERTDHYMAVLNEDETRVTLDGDVDRQLWGLRPVSGGYKLISYKNNKYVTTTATGNQLVLNDEGSVFTVETGAESGTFYLKSGAQYLKWDNGWKLVSDPFALKLYTPVLETLDLTGREEAQLLFSGTGSDQPCKPGLGGSNQFRIPALITLSNGWLVAAADVRWSHGVDNPSNLETIVSVSKDNGQTWDWEFVNYFGDYANTVSDRLSTAFIDPALIQDPATGKVWMLVDVTSADGKGTSGSTGFDSQDRLLVAHVPAYVDQRAPGDAGLYTYYVSKEGTEFTVNGAAVTLYPIESSTGATDCNGLYVDAFYNIYHVNGDTVEREMVLQHGSDKIVQDNLFFRQSEWRVFPTCYLMFRSAEVNEAAGTLEWSDPIFTNLRGTTPGAGAAFFGAGPGRGFIADDGRILFTAYDNVGGEHASSIYSDDHGVTWHRGGRAQNTVGNKTSESQIIRLPDGSLRMYSRNVNSRYVSYSDSTDGGETWGVTKLDEGWGYCSNCMISVINVEGTLTAPDGTVYDNIIAASYPEGNGQYTNAYAHRNTGVVRFGSVGTDADHTVTWLGEVNKLLGTANFVYSCLTQIQVDGKASDRFGWLYEPYAIRGHGINDVTYKELTVAEVLGEGWTLTVEEPEEPEEPEEHGDLSRAAVTVSPTSVISGGTLTVTVSGVPEDVTDVTLTKDGDHVALTKGRNGTYIGTETAPVGSGERTIVFILSAANCDAKRIDVTITLMENSTGGNTGDSGSSGNTGSSGSNQPTTPPEEELDDPEVPLASLPKLFEDVKGDDWFYDAAKFVVEQGLMMGVSETSFEPHMNTTRGMIVTILYRMEQEPEVAPAKFVDVASGSWYSGGAAWGEQTGIAKGMADGNFRATDDVTREQLAVFLFRFAELRGYDISARGDLTVFHDGGTVSDWAEDAMRWAVATGLINGKGADGLDPLSTATRGEVAAILMRFCNSMEKKTDG